MSAAVSIPVIASGGAGNLDHFVDVFTAGRADAALAASIFHYAETSVRALKEHLEATGAFRYDCESDTKTRLIAEG